MLVGKKRCKRELLWGTQCFWQSLGVLGQRTFKSCLHRQGCVNRCVCAWVHGEREGNRRQKTSDGGIKDKRAYVHGFALIATLSLAAQQLRNRLFFEESCPFVHSI